MPRSRRSAERTPWPPATSNARSVVRCRIADAPSGGSGESQACRAASTRSAGSRARAPPPAPWPSSRHSVGEGRVTRSARQRAISAASPPSSASRVSAAPAVSTTVSSGSPSSAASRIPRRASRRPAGPSGGASAPRRSWPRTTQGAPPIRASARHSPGSCSPAPVPLNGVTDVPATLNRSRTPGRSGRRERRIESAVPGTGPAAARDTSSGTPGETAFSGAGAGHRTSRARPMTAGSSPEVSTASTRP